MSDVSWSIKIKGSAAKALRRMDPQTRGRLIEVIDGLAMEPAADAMLRGEFSGLRRLRVGRYRIIYQVLHNQSTILVVRIGHRRDVYR